MAMTIEQQRALAIAQARRRRAEAQGGQQQSAPQPGQAQPKPFNVLPFSEDVQGNISFDSDAGIVGAIKRAVTLPGDVFTGKVEPTSDEAIGRSFELGAMASPLNPGIRVGDRAIPGAARLLRKPDLEPPSSEALKKAGSAGYDELRDMGVDYSSDAVGALARSLRAELEKDGILAELAPKSFRILRKLENPPEGSVASIGGLEAARRSFRHAAQDFSNPTEQLAAKRIVEGLDGFVQAGDPSTVVAGSAARAGEVSRSARGNIAASKRSDRITGVEETAERRAAAANSGHNIDNAIRQRIASVLQDPKKRAGFDKAEIDALETVSRGTRGRNTARNIGNYLGGGGGLGAMLTTSIGGAGGAAAGGVVGGGIGAALPLATGITAKQIANALTKRSLGKADKMTRKRSPLYEEMQKAAPLEAVSPQKRAALVRALLLSGSGAPAAGYNQDALIREIIRQPAPQ